MPAPCCCRVHRRNHCRCRCRLRRRAAARTSSAIRSGSRADLAAELPPQELIGRWGLAAYHRPDDRARTEAAARNQCKQPYVIGAGPSGGLIMHLADQKEPQELQLKGSRGGKNYIGPRDDPPGGEQDREVVSFDGRVLITRWIDPEISGRYGNAVYVRCAPRA